MARGRGGARTPSKPAAVSGPGALSQRTDGRPQPVRPEANAGGYGDRKEAIAIQSAAPMRSGGAPAPISSPDEMGEPVAVPIDPFGPTNRPAEPITAGARFGAGPGMPDAREDVVAWLAELNMRAPGRPGVAALLEDLQREMRA